MPKQSRLTGAISLSIAQAVVLLFGYITHPLIGRFLGPGPYGIYGVVLNVQTIVGLFLTLGVPVAVARYVAQNEKHARDILRQALQIQTTLALLIALIAYLASPFAARSLHDLSLLSYLRYISLIIFFQAFYPIYVQYLSGLHRFHRQAILTSVYAVAKLIAALVLLYLFALKGALAGFAVGGVVAASLGWYWTQRSHYHATAYRVPLKKFLSFAGLYMVILVGLQILISQDLLMVKAFIGDNVQVGFYNAASTLSRIPYLLLQGLAFILLPSVSALTKPGKSHTEAVQFIRSTLRYLIALIVPSVALAATTSKSLIILFYSHNYIPGAPVLTVLMVGLGSLAFYLLLINIVAGAGRAHVGVAITLLLIVTSLGLGAILIPRYGLIGAAWQTTVSGLLGLFLLSAYTFRTFGIPLPTRSIINIVIASVIAVLPTYIWPSVLLTLPLLYIVSAGLYLATLLALREITPADRQLVAGIHPRLAWLVK